MKSTAPAADAHEGIFEFLEELRRDGFRIGVREHVAARALLIALRAEGKDGNFAEFGPWIAPIVCASPADQAGFDERWRKWVARQRAEPAGNVVTAARPEVEIARHWIRHAVLAALGSVAIVVAALTVLEAWFADEPVPEQNVLPGHSEKPAPALLPAEMPDLPAFTAAIPVVGWTRGFDANVLRGHQFPVMSAVFSPDGLQVLTASADKTARLFDAQDGRELAVFRGHENVLHSAVFSPGGSRVLTASHDGTARLFNLEGQEFRVFSGHSGPVYSAVFSPDGSRVLTASHDGTARLFDLQGLEVRVCSGHNGPVYRAVFSPDGRRVLTASGDRTARLFDLQGNGLVTYAGHVDLVRRAVFSPDGSRVLTASNDKTARLFDLQGKQLITFAGHEDTLWSAVFSPDGSRVLTASNDKTARLFDLQGKQLITFAGHEDGLWSAVFSPDGSRVLTASNDKTARLFDLRGNELVTYAGHGDSAWIAVFSPDGSRIVTASADGTARLFELRDEASKVFRGHEGRVWSAAFSPKGGLAASAGSDGTVRLWNLGDGKPRGRPLIGHERGVYSVAFSSLGDLLASGGGEGTVRLWNLDNGTPHRPPLSGHGDAVYAVAFSPDGRYVASGGVDSTVRLWSVDEGVAHGQPLKADEGSVRCVAFSPDSKLVASGSGDGSVHLWSVADGASVGKSLRGHERSLSSIAFSPNGLLIVTASVDRTVRIFDAGVWHQKTLGTDAAKSGSPESPVRRIPEPLVLRGHEATVHSAVFSPDGSRILTASEDATVALWDIATQTPLRVMRAHSGPVNSAVFDSSGRYILSASDDGTVRVWSADEEHGPSLALIAVAGIACLLLWSFLRVWFSRWSLRRRATKIGDRVQNISLPVQALRAHDPLGARRQAAQLRRAALVGTADLDVDRTVQRTIEGGGFVQVVRRGRPQTPEYLALVERVSPRDHLARYVDERLARLRDEGIPVERMSFLGDPSVVFMPEGRGSFAALADVQVRYPGHRVWTIGESRVLSGAIVADAAWLEDFAAWPHRSFVIPDGTELSPDLGHELARVGVRLGAINDPAATLEEPGGPIAPTRERRTLFPPSLRHEVERWMSPTAPPPHHVRLAFDELRRYLGPELFRWCATCAVYPELHYELTIQIARLVLPSRAIGDEDLVRLARLPWFRRGRMPDWLRRALLEELPHENEARVRDWFLRAFTQTASASVEGEDSKLELPIAQEARTQVGEAFRSEAAQSRADPRADPAFRDAVFLTWMDDRLAVAVPRRIARALRRSKNPAAAATLPAPRPPWRALVGALAAGFLLAWLSNSLGEFAEVRAGVFVAAAYAVLVAGARRFQGGRFPRVLLALELVAVFMGVIAAEVAESRLEPEIAFSVSLVYGLPLLAWITFEVLTIRARRHGLSNRFERIADGLMLDRLIGWLSRDHSHGEAPADLAAGPVRMFMTTPLIAGGVVATAWALEHGGQPNEWVWASAGLLLAGFSIASALAQPKRNSRHWWISSMLEAFATGTAVLLASAWMSKEVDWGTGLTYSALLAAGIGLIVAILAALRRRRHPLYGAVAPLLTLCDTLVLESWLDELRSRLRARRRSALPEVSK